MCLRGHLYWGICFGNTGPKDEEEVAKNSAGIGFTELGTKCGTVMKPR